MLLITFIMLLYCSPGSGNVVSNANYSKHDFFINSPSKEPAWIEVARYLRESIDFTVDPCDNFFKFACGGWNKLNPIPDSLDRQDAFTVVRDIVKDNLRNIFAGDTLSNHSSRTLRIAKQVFDACLVQDVVKVNQSHPLMIMVDELGGWPLFDPSKWNETNFHLEKTLGLLWRQHSLPSLISPLVTADKWNSSMHILYLDQAFLSFGTKSEDYYIKQSKDFAEVRDGYIRMIRQVLQLLLNDFGRDPNLTDEMEKEIKEILDFEISVAHLNVPAHKRREETSMLRKIGFMDIVYVAPNFDWASYAEGLSMAEEFNSNVSIIIVGDEYIPRLSMLLSNTTKQTMANYLVWRLILDQTTFLDQRYRDALYDFVKIMRGAAEPKRTDFCIAYMTGEPNDGREFFGYAVGRVFVDNYFTSDSKMIIADMMEHIVGSFIHFLEELDWMDEQTKKAALEKAESIYASIGYPDFITEDDLLDNYYSDLLPPLDNETSADTAIQPNDSLFIIHNKVTRWMVNKLIFRIGRPFEREVFGGSPAIVNAWYSHAKNSIVFPAAILQPPFFHSSYPKAVNYGAMGSVIGHEVTHAFDDQGSQYDRHGNLVNWWSNSSKKNFKDRKKCIISQYSKYCYPNLEANACLNGYHTQGENIADNGGLKNAFAGYRKYVELHGEEARLPGLEHYSMEQVFFLSFASFWCGHYKDRRLINILAVNEHAPGEYRVIGSLQNSKEFRDVFNCSAGSRMSPEKWCAVW